MRQFRLLISKGISTETSRVNSLSGGRKTEHAHAHTRKYAFLSQQVNTRTKVVMDKAVDQYDLDRTWPRSPLVCVGVGHTHLFHWDLLRQQNPHSSHAGPSTPHSALGDKHGNANSKAPTWCSLPVYRHNNSSPSCQRWNFIFIVFLFLFFSLFCLLHISEAVLKHTVL